MAYAAGARHRVRVDPPARAPREAWAWKYAMKRLWHDRPQPYLPAWNHCWAPALDRPPSLDQTQPELPVALVPRGGGETAAFIDAPLEFVMAAIADDPEGEGLNGGLGAEHDTGSWECTISNAWPLGFAVAEATPACVEQNKNFRQAKTRHGCLGGRGVWLSGRCIRRRGSLPSQRRRAHERRAVARATARRGGQGSPARPLYRRQNVPAAPVEQL